MKDQLVCVFYPAPSKRDRSLLFQNRRDILNTTLLTRITAHKQWRSDKHKHLMQLLKNNANE